MSNMELPTIEVMVKILYCSLLEDYPDMTMEKVCSLLDAYFEEAHDVVSAQVVLFMILGQVAGFFKGAENPQALMKRALENIPQKTNSKK